jgi:large subunit ribosomal protein L21
MKYAIVEDGGKQYKAVEGGSIDVDFYPAEIGEPVDLEHVLLIAEDGNVNVGKPYVTGARVQAKVSEQVKGPKLVVFRYKPKKRIRRKTGHRQKYTRLQIESIAINGSATDGSATDVSKEK